MDVHLPGPVEVLVDGRPVALGATRQRALLAMLALDAGRAVSADRLAEGLWGEQVPASATRWSSTTFRSCAASEIRRLGELRLRALELAIDSDPASGRHLVS
jgi:hypothetical protein